MSKTIYIGGRLESKAKGNVVTGANAILDDTKGKKQNVINKETDDELLRLEQSKQDNLTFDNAPTENSTNPVTSGGVYTAEKALSDAIEAILLIIPSAATALNKLVDTNTMNSSISTATATFRGTYNAVSDLGLTYQATHAQIEAALDALGLTADNNDYAFVQVPVSDQSQDIAKTERYKNNGTNWQYEYDLNTSGFTAAQWGAINSTITLTLVQKLAALPTNAELLQALGLKQDVLTFDNAPTTDSNNPVKSGGIKNAIDTAAGDEATARENADLALAGLIGDEKTRAEGIEGGLNNRLGAVEGSVTTIQGVIPSGATSSNKLVDNNSMTTYISTIIDNIDATFNVTSTDGHVTLAIIQVNGVITSVQLTTTDIASAAALNLKASQADLTALAGRVTTAEGNITSLTGRMTTAESDIDTLTALYNALQQSAPQVIQPTDTWPVANPSTTVIYRVIDRVNTPPEYYSDYMWNGTSMVLMATYNNAVDTTPKKDSANLITSGGVFANIGAFDISEYHKSGSTLATYADLTAALAAIPSDYQKGGMSIKFVQSSDNKYVQYRCVAQNFTTDVTQWQGVDDEPTEGSDNLVKSGGVAKEIRRIDGELGTENTYTTTGTIIPVTTGDVFDKMVLTKPSAGNYVIYAAFRKADTSLISPYVLNPNTIDGSLFEANNVIVPNDAVDLLLGGTTVGLNAELKLYKYGIKKDIANIQEHLDEIDLKIDGKKQIYELYTDPETHTAVNIDSSIEYPSIKLTNTDNETRLYYIQERDSNDNVLGYLYNPSFTLYLESGESVVFNNVSLISGTAKINVGSNTAIYQGDVRLEIVEIKSEFDKIEEQVEEIKSVTDDLSVKPYNVLETNKKRLHLFKTLFRNKKCDIYNRCVVSFNGDSILGSQLEEVAASPEYNTGDFPPNMSRMIAARKFYDAYKFTGEDTIFRNLAHNDWIKSGFAISNKLNGAAFNRFEDYGGAEGDTAIISTSGYKFFKLIWSGKYGYDYNFIIEVSTDGTTYVAPSTLGIELPDSVTNDRMLLTLQKYVIADVSTISYVKIILGNTNPDKACIWGCEMWNNKRLDVVVQAFSGSIAKWNYEQMLDGYYGDYHKPQIIITDILALNDGSYIESPQENYQLYEWMMYNAKLYDYCQNHGIPMLLIRTHFGSERYGEPSPYVVAAEGIGYTRNECAYIDISKMQDVENIPMAQIVGQDGLHLSTNGNQLYFNQIALLMG